MVTVAGRKPSEAVNASEEQLHVVRQVCAGHNVVVDAIAGSGKSTTIVTLAKTLPEKRILQITYNAMLRKEFRTRVSTEELANIEVHTYHSLGVKYFTSLACTDTGIRNAVHLRLPPQVPLPAFDIVCLDECQDQTPLYFHFVQYVLSLLPKPVQLVILGDYMQCLYEFKGADVRFLTMAPRLWAGEASGPLPPYLLSNTFVRCSLQTSYRVTRQMADFINCAMVGDTRIHAVRNGEPVQYLRNSRANLEKVVIYHIQCLLKEGNVPDDFFILGPSVKGTMSNIRRLENALVESGIPCHVPTFEADKMDDKVIEGKIVFSSFHSVKGRQRKFVFVVGFDQSYFDIYARTMDPLVCPNTLYVACTRATHKLFLLETDQYATDRPLSFLCMTHHEMKDAEYVDFKGHPRTVFWEREEKVDPGAAESPRQVSVSEMLRFLPEELLDALAPQVRDLFRVDDAFAGRGFADEEIPSVVAFGTAHEDVSDLNGIAIPCMYYDELSNRAYTPTVLYQLIRNAEQDMRTHEHGYLKQVFRQLSPSCTTISEYLYMANVYSAFQERLYFKLKQIKRSEYTWISDAVMERCIALLDDVIGETEYINEEETILAYGQEHDHRLIDHVLREAMNVDGTPHASVYRFKARVDLVADHDVWELKCVRQVTLEHQLQVIVYAWLWHLVHPDRPKTFHLFNIKTAEHHVLGGTVTDWTAIVVALLRGKYEVTDPLDDDAFLAMYGSA